VPSMPVRQAEQRTREVARGLGEQVLVLLESLRDDQLIDTPAETYDRMTGARDGLLGVPAGSADVEHRGHYAAGWAQGERFRELLVAAGVR